MIDLLKQYYSELLSFAAGFAGGSLVTLNVKRNSSREGNIVDQSKASAGGDIVAGSKISKNDR